VQQIEWEGLKAVELTTPALRLIGVYEFGPLLAWLGKPGGDNLFLWDSTAAPSYAREVEGREVWYLRGGHRVWVARPGADECEETYCADNNPADCEVFKNGFTLTGALDGDTRTRRGLTVRALDDETLEVDNFVLSASDMLYSAGMWALTCTVPGKGARYVIPLGDGTSWDSAAIVLFREWGGHGQGVFADDQFLIEDDAMVITPKGKEGKRMVQGASGIMAMSDPARSLTFAKKMAYCPHADYPLLSNIAAYIGPGNFMVEMETMGPAKTIKPKQDLHHVEIWKLRGSAMKVPTGKAARALFA
jgi:hypothetical protein